MLIFTQNIEAHSQNIEAHSHRTSSNETSTKGQRINNIHLSQREGVW